MVRLQTGAHGVDVLGAELAEAGQGSGFGALVRARRRALRLSVGACAERGGLSKSYLSEIERGLRPPPSEVIVRDLERVLALREGRLLAAARLERTPIAIREELGNVHSSANAARRLAAWIFESEVGPDGRLLGALRGAMESGEAQRVAAAVGGDVLASAPTAEVVERLPTEVPVVGTAHAGGSSAGGVGGGGGSACRESAEVIVHPGVTDGAAYAVRVVGDGMEPELRGGDVVVASPGAAGTARWDGSVRVIRLTGARERRVARVYDAGRGRVRLQPTRSAIGPDVVSARRVRSADRVVLVSRAML